MQPDRTPDAATDRGRRVYSLNASLTILANTREEADDLFAEWTDHEANGGGSWTTVETDEWENDEA